MPTNVAQITDRIYRLSTWFPNLGPGHRDAAGRSRVLALPDLVPAWPGRRPPDHAGPLLRHVWRGYRAEQVGVIPPPVPVPW